MAASQPVLQLKLSLVGASKPPVWRRLLVPATIRLNRLHDIIQAAMGWEDYHLHAFEAGGVDYGPPDQSSTIGTSAGRRFTTSSISLGIGCATSTTSATTGITTSWLRRPSELRSLRATRSASPGRDAARRKTAAACGEYADLRETLADPTSEDHADMLEWLGIENAAEFDPHAFDADEVNVVLDGRIGVA